jgi:hypothetical protein
MNFLLRSYLLSVAPARAAILLAIRRGAIVASSLLALLLFASPGWTQRRLSMGTTPMSHTPVAFGQSARGFPIFPTGGTGAFTPTMHSAFVPTPGSIDRAITSNHPPIFGANGTIIPGTPGFVTSGLRPVSPANFVSDISNPISNPIFSSSPYAHMLRQYDRTLWREAAWSNSSSPYGSSGSASPSSGYGSSSYGSGSSYGNGSGYQAGAPSTGATNGTSNAYPAYGNADTTQTRPFEVLRAFGVPVEFGQVQWPLALRTMPPDIRRDLLDKLEAQMRIAASQAINGNASQALLRETKTTIDSAKWWLRGRRSTMPESTYQDGGAFLRQLEDSLRRMEP